MTTGASGWVLIAVELKVLHGKLLDDILVICGFVIRVEVS